MTRKQAPVEQTSIPHFYLVQCENDEWQAFLEGHQAPLSDHVPLDRALKVLSDLASICPHASLKSHRRGQAQYRG